MVEEHGTYKRIRKQCWETLTHTQSRIAFATHPRAREEVTPDTHIAEEAMLYLRIKVTPTVVELHRILVHSSTLCITHPTCTRTHGERRFYCFGSLAIPDGNSPSSSSTERTSSPHTLSCTHERGWKRRLVRPAGKHNHPLVARTSLHSLVPAAVSVCLSNHPKVALSPSAPLRSLAYTTFQTRPISLSLFLNLGEVALEERYTQLHCISLSIPCILRTSSEMPFDQNFRMCGEHTCVHFSLLLLYVWVL